jgi:hypothetical protein
MWKGKHQSTDNTINKKRKGKLKRCPDETHTQTHGTLNDIF